jgi:hypothetical protein
LVSQTWRRIIDPKKYVSPVCVWRIINDYKTSPDDDGIPSSLNFEKHTHTHTQQQTQRNTTHFWYSTTWRSRIFTITECRYHFLFSNLK